METKAASAKADYTGSVTFKATRVDCEQNDTFQRKTRNYTDVHIDILDTQDYQKMNTIIKYFICALICSACTPHTTEQTDYVEVDVKTLSPLSTIFDGYRHVRLQTPDSCIIRSIDKIIPTDSMLFIQDASTIFICDYDGKFLKKIDKQGHGKGEYLKINDFDVHGNLLWILDSQLSKLRSYTFEGTFVREYTLPDTYHSLRMQPNGNAFLCAQQSNDDLYNFVLYDTSKKCVISRLANFKMNQSCTESSFHDFIGQNADTLIVANRFDNTVYNLTTDNYSPRMAFTFNTDEQLPKDSEHQDYSQLMELTQFKNVVKHPYIYHHDPSQIILGYYLFDDYGDSYYLTRIAADGTQSTSRLLATIDNDFPYASPIITQYGNEFVSFLQAAQILNIEKYAKIDMFTSAGLDKSDNPVIFFHHIRIDNK